MTLGEEIIVCAVRYALGRQSYIVGDVCKYVTIKHDCMSDHCKNVIIKDIEESIEWYHSTGHTCGMECDEKDWLKLLDVLKGE